MAKTATATPVTIGRIVTYTLTREDVEAIERRRTTPERIARRLDDNPPSWPAGAQAHIGNAVEVGDTFPLIVTRVNGEYVSGQVLLDGNDVLWVRSVPQGEGGGCWAWPEKG